mgnify:CR=1 FL=1
MYRALNPEKTIQTLQTLGQRIDERFPTASLGNVCRELLQIARETHERVNWSARSLPWIRVGVCAVILAAIAAVWFAVRYIKLQGQPELEELDAGFNVMILFGASLFFLLSLESRIKRHHILQALHELLLERAHRDPGPEFVALAQPDVAGLARVAVVAPHHPGEGEIGRAHV